MQGWRVASPDGGSLLSPAGSWQQCSWSCHCGCKEGPGGGHLVRTKPEEVYRPGQRAHGECGQREMGRGLRTRCSHSLGDSEWEPKQPDQGPARKLGDGQGIAVSGRVTASRSVGRAHTESDVGLPTRPLTTAALTSMCPQQVGQDVYSEANTMPVRPVPCGIAGEVTPCCD